MKRRTKSPANQAADDSKAIRTLLADIVESSSDAIFSRSLDGIITSWNAGARRIFGYRRSEIVGKSGAILLPPDRAGEQTELIEKVRTGERIEDFETARMRKGGDVIAVSMTVSPIRNAARRIVGLSTIARDISVQRRLESELLKMSERERRRIGRDLHDGLGQQLTGMELLCRTLADALVRTAAPEAATAKLLMTEIRSSLEQIRALARGLTPVIDTPNGLMLALQDLSEHVSRIFRVRCSFKCSEATIIAEHATAVHLYRIAQESVTNAIRHGRARQVRISLGPVKNGVRLTVRDDGRGFPRRARKTHGLGLHIMQYRATMLRGSLKIEQNEKRGAHVVCFVPSPNGE